MKEDSGKKKYNSIIQVTIFMLCINSVCVATVQEFNDINDFNTVAGEPQYFIDFESYGDGTPVPPGDVNVTGDEWLNLGIQFAEMEIGFSMILSAKPGMNVSPTNDPGHALAIAGLSPGNDRSSFLITFSTPVASFGVYIVDNETGGPGAYPIERIILKDEDGNIIGDFAMPGGAGPAPPLPFAHDFIGYSSTIPIAEVHIIEGNDGEGALLDNVMYSVPEPTAPEMVLIPGGEFEMGDHYGEGGSNELPIHLVHVDSFRMSKYEITNQQYCDFLNSADVKVDGGIVYASSDSSNSYRYCDTHSYSSFSQIDYSSSVFSVITKAGRDMSDDPMVMVTWYGAAAYCNWISDQESYQQLYDPCNPNWPCDFSKNGYRLPTEAEWEYAGRGGLSGKRFPWSGDTISHSQANYKSYWQGGSPYYPYDVSPTEGFHPDWNDGIYPYTASVGSFSPNGYGLYDMAGNAFEWCNDWYSETYYQECDDIGRVNNPEGPVSGSYRVFRNGSWDLHTENCRVAERSRTYPYNRSHDYGFRVARTADPIEQILDFIDESVGAGTLAGDGPGKSADGRLGALINMIEAAGNLIDAGDPDLLVDACGQLQSAYNRTDGNSPPPDFVIGDSASELATKIAELMTSLGCE